MNKVTTIESCEVCGETNLKTVLDLGEHPLCDDLKPVSSNISCLNYPIQILLCENCKTAHQKYQVPKNDDLPLVE